MTGGHVIRDFRPSIHVVKVFLWQHFCFGRGDSPAANVLA
jgi:hypothetical protein